VAVFVGFALGKPVGILTFSWLAVRSGIAIRPPDLDWRLLAGGGLLAGIGFTMAWFIANLVATYSGGWSKLQRLVAALGVGIGSGLQEIVANFICGLILVSSPSSARFSLSSSTTSISEGGCSD